MSTTAIWVVVICILIPLLIFFYFGFINRLNRPFSKNVLERFFFPRNKEEEETEVYNNTTNREENKDMKQ